MSQGRPITLANVRQLYRLLTPLSPGARVAGYDFVGLRHDARACAWVLDWRGAAGDALSLTLASRDRLVEPLAGGRVVHVGRMGPLPTGGRALARALGALVTRNEARMSAARLASIVNDLRSGVLFAYGDLMEIRLTPACNQRCPMCNSAGAVDNLVSDMAWLARRLPALYARGVRSLTLTGGEPTLVPGLVGLLSDARRAGMERLALQTNALRFAEPRFAASFAAGARPDLILVSLHAHRPEVYDRIVGVAGTHTAAVAGLDWLVARGYWVALSHVVQRANLSDVAGFVSWAAERYGARVEIAFSLVVDNEHVRGDDLAPRLSEAGDAVAEALERARALGVHAHVSHRCGLPPCMLPWDIAETLSLQLQEVSDAGEKIFGPGCDDCRFRAGCTGVWPGYAARGAVDELRPVPP